MSEYMTAGSADYAQGFGIAPAHALSSDTLSSRPLHRNRAKRALDIMGALAAIVLFGPLMLIVALLIRLDGGPALFRHNRVGADGKLFPCLKFRSMRTNSQEMLKELLERSPAARAEWDATQKLRNDPRVTAVGRFLRKTSLDELPQFFNVLFGDMSLVGPRPITTVEAERYNASFEAYKRCRPGITGLWQVSGRSDVDYDHRVRMDLRYVSTWSIFRDIRILLKTPVVVLRGSGAY